MIRVSLEHCLTITSAQNKPYMVIFKSLWITSTSTHIKPIQLHFKDTQYGGQETINARNVSSVGRSEDILKILQNESLLITQFFLPLSQMFRIVILTFHILNSKFCKRLISFFFQKKRKTSYRQYESDQTVKMQATIIIVVSLGLGTSVFNQYHRQKLLMLLPK